MNLGIYHNHSLLLLGRRFFPKSDGKPTQRDREWTILNPPFRSHHFPSATTIIESKNKIKSNPLSKTTIYHSHHEPLYLYLLNLHILFPVHRFTAITLSQMDFFNQDHNFNIYIYIFRYLRHLGQGKTGFMLPTFKQFGQDVLVELWCNNMIFLILSKRASMLF